MKINYKRDYFKCTKFSTITYWGDTHGIEIGKGNEDDEWSIFINHKYVTSTKYLKDAKKYVADVLLNGELCNDN